MFTDPQVVRLKVERELTDFVERIDYYRAKGIWVLEYRFPELLVAFAARNLKPYPIAPYGVLMDLRNYDVEPPSVKFVNPFTREPLQKKDIPTELPRARLLPAPPQPTAPEPAGNSPDGNVQAMGPQMQTDLLLQSWTGDDYPFICLQGVREYHQNPGHTGDPWWLHRGKGAGGIARLLELISKYGTEQMVQLNFQIQVIPIGIGQQLSVMDQS